MLVLSWSFSTSCLHAPSSIIIFFSALCWLAHTGGVITGSVTGSVTLIDGNTGSETFNVGTVGIKVVMFGMLVMTGRSCPISHG